ncbi:MAG TPA: metallophosphoesterase [Burkholderiaceae bacterium]|nr:metallophosphoesterase [Burkholderiaceae bacterium]
MDAPSLALRFRDIGPDSILEHQKVIKQEGAVWWGWWKKDAERPTQSALDALKLLKEQPILLVNRRDRKSYIGRCLRTEQQPNDEKRVPEYYRSNISQIQFWLLLNHIEECAYDEKMGGNFEENTILEINAPLVGKPQPLAAPVGKKFSLLHLSDLHFGDDHGFPLANQKTDIGDTRKRMHDCLMDDLERLNLHKDIAGIVITGDLTTRGDWSDQTMGIILREVGDIASSLSVPRPCIFTTPGNHDIVRYAEGAIPEVKGLVDKQVDQKHERDYRLFRYKLNGTPIEEPLNSRHELHLGDSITLQICALNSCSIVPSKWTEYGYVGEFGAQLLDKLGKAEPLPLVYRLIALHHHLMPISTVDYLAGSGVSVTLDAVKILDAAQRANVHLALHGHQHMPRLTHYRNVEAPGETPSNGIYIMAGGSTGASEKRRTGSERNSYSVMTFSEKGIHVRSRELRTDSRTGSFIFNTHLPVQPIRG